MAQKPIDKRRPDETRAAIWQAIRDTRGKGGEPNSPFTIHDIWAQTRCTRDIAREYIVSLAAGGFLQKLSPAPGSSSPLYVLLRDTGVEAPRVRRNGTLVTQGIGREQMWRTLKIAGADFSCRDLAISASTDEHHVQEHEAKDYLYHLHRAGYLIITVEGGPARLTRYRLLPSKYTGPRPPQIQRVKQVYDPNIGKVVWKGAADDSQ